jgi:hypothetical protein
LYTKAERAKGNKSRSVATSVSRGKGNVGRCVVVASNNCATALQRKSLRLISKTSSVVQRTYDSWGWATPAPTADQINEAAADIFGRMQAVDQDWNHGANTYVNPLAAQAPAINHVINAATHLTINEADFRAAVRAAVINGDEEDAAFNRVQNLNWHVTIELNGANDANNPRYYSNTATWVNLPADYDVTTLQGIVTEGTDEMAQLHS